MTEFDPEVPEEVRGLVAEREEARRNRDFAAADALRDRIAAAGFEVTDTPEGTRVHAASAPPLPRPVPPAAVESVLDRPPTFDATVHWIVEGWPEDAVRGVAAFRRHHPSLAVQHVVVDVTEGDGPWPGDAEVLRLVRGTGWAEARNAGLRRTLGRIVVVADGSVEPEGDVLGRLERTLEDPGVGLTGPFGIVTDDLREFHESPGPDVDAVEGYLMALPRRLLAEEGLGFDPGFRFYRTADIELSFRVKALGLRVVVTDVPVVRHEHRMWTATPEDERERLSRRNFRRFLDRWRDRGDLTVRAASRREGPGG